MLPVSLPTSFGQAAANSFGTLGLTTAWAQRLMILSSGLQLTCLTKIKPADKLDTMD